MPATRSPEYDDKTDEAPVPPRSADAPAPVLEPNEARAGVTHHNVRWVLAISLAGVVAALVLVYVAFFH